MRRVASGFLLALPLVGASCATEAPLGPPACAELAWNGPRPGTNVVLVVNDTMRRDRVGVYGGPARTPAFDRFAGENLLFERAFTQAPWTKPAMATLFTALYPSQHGVISHPEVGRDGRALPGGALQPTEALSAEHRTLAEVLGDHGYRTAAFVSNPWLERRFGFDQGFETYDDSFAAWDVPGEVVTRAGLDWLAERPTDQPFFLYLHYMDSHRPYPPLSRWDVLRLRDELFVDSEGLPDHAATAIARLVSLEERLTVEEAGLEPSLSLFAAAYDRGIERFDAALAELLEGLQAHPAWERTAVIVTSDHGEALFTRGYDNHGNGLYEDEVAIPMAMRLPGVRGTAGPVGCPVGLIDPLPTLCSYLDLRCPEPSFGRSLLDPAPPDAGPAYVLTEGVAGKPENRAIRDREFKLIRQPQRGLDGSGDLLFHISEDPGETTDLLESEELAPVVGTLDAALTRAVPAYAAPDAPKVPLDPELRRRLRSLGYVE